MILPIILHKLDLLRLLQRIQRIRVCICVILLDVCNFKFYKYDRFHKTSNKIARDCVKNDLFLFIVIHFCGTMRFS